MEGYDPATTVLLFNGQTRRLDQLKMDDILMGPNGTPRNIVKLQQVDNVDGVNLYRLVLAWNQTPPRLDAENCSSIDELLPHIPHCSQVVLAG